LSCAQSPRVVWHNNLPIREGSATGTRFTAGSFKPTEIYMRAYFTPERTSNILHVVLLAMIGLASLRVVAHVAERLI
jgi:hypothetical protein